MFEIPEYHSLRTNDPRDDKVVVSVKIDGGTPMPSITMRPDVLARLVEAFFHGKLDFMSFDEHPKRLTKISVAREGKIPKVMLTAKSLTEKDEFPRDWEIIDPQVYGADPWDGQMK